MQLKLLNCVGLNRFVSNTLVRPLHLSLPCLLKSWSHHISFISIKIITTCSINNKASYVKIYRFILNDLSFHIIHPPLTLTWWNSYENLTKLLHFNQPLVKTYLRVWTHLVKRKSPKIFKNTGKKIYIYIYVCL